MLIFRFNTFFAPATALFLLLPGLNTSVIAQYVTATGARSSAMGNATITLPDAFSVFINPASAVLSGESTAALFFDHRYHLSGLSNLAVAANYRLNSSSLMAGVARFGDELLNHSLAEVAFAHKIRNVALGGGAGYHQLFVAENGSAGNITFQLGGLAQISPRLTYAASVYNLSRSGISREKQVYYPVLMKMGFSYRPVQKATLSAEIEKDSRFEPNLKAGLEYRIFEKLIFRTGLNTNPVTGFLGFGIKLKGLMFDYGISVHPRLGLTHYLGLGLGFGKTTTTKN